MPTYIIVTYAFLVYLKYVCDNHFHGLASDNNPYLHSMLILTMLYLIHSKSVRVCLCGWYSSFNIFHQPMGVISPLPQLILRYVIINQRRCFSFSLLLRANYTASIRLVVTVFRILYPAEKINAKKIPSFRFLNSFECLYSNFVVSFHILYAFFTKQVLWQHFNWLELSISIYTVIYELLRIMGKHTWCNIRPESPTRLKSLHKFWYNFDAFVMPYFEKRQKIAIENSLYGKCLLKWLPTTNRYAKLMVIACLPMILSGSY